MKMSQAFPSKYVRAADLNGKRMTLTMSHVHMESVADGEPDKPVLYFNGAQKGMVLNQTNGMMIASLYGDDTDTWGGKPIELYTAMVPFGGKTVPAIRVMAPASEAPLNTGDQPPSDFQNESAFASQADEPLDDSIPF